MFLRNSIKYCLIDMDRNLIRRGTAQDLADYLGIDRSHLYSMVTKGSRYLKDGKYYKAVKNATYEEMTRKEDSIEVVETYLDTYGNMAIPYNPINLIPKLERDGYIVESRQDIIYLEDNIIKKYWILEGKHGTKIH